MSELVSHAIRFATQAHERIDHRRKYSGQPDTDHLKQVAGIVGSVTDDPETIAAAWLHDVVEDTPATIDDLERESGLPVARPVHSLTETHGMHPTKLRIHPVPIGQVTTLPRKKDRRVRSAHQYPGAWNAPYGCSSPGRMKDPKPGQGVRLEGVRACRGGPERQIGREQI